MGSCEVIKINSQPVLPGIIKMEDHSITLKKPPEAPKTLASHKIHASTIKRKWLSKWINQNSNQTKPIQTKKPTLLAREVLQIWYNGRKTLLTT
jgi:hypothetical protein